METKAAKFKLWGIRFDDFVEIKNQTRLSMSASVCLMYSQEVPGLCLLNFLTTERISLKFIFREIIIQGLQTAK